MRLAIRSEGTYVVAWLATSMTSMKGAMHLGTIRKRFVDENDALFDRWRDLMKDSVSVLLAETASAAEVQWNEPVPAPAHEVASPNRAAVDMTEADRLRELPLLMAEWLSYRRAVYDEALPPVQEDEGRRCFISGFAACMNLYAGLAEISDDAGVAMLERVTAELRKVPELEFPEDIPPQFAQRPKQQG